MEIIGIINQKGGVGKTVSAINIAIGLANEGKRVLLIDLDPQGSSTISLGYRDENLGTTIYTLLKKIINDEQIDPSEGILHHSENIDLVPADIELAGLEITLASVMSRETTLRDYIRLIIQNYDVIVLDCSPSLGMLTINALTCADKVIIPVQAQYLALKGMEQLFQSITKVRRHLNPNLEIAGILITMVDFRSKYSKEIIEIIRHTYKDKLRVFESIIPYSIRASEMTAEGKSIFAHDSKGKVANAYRELIEEVNSI